MFRSLSQVCLAYSQTSSERDLAALCDCKMFLESDRPQDLHTGGVWSRKDVSWRKFWQGSIYIHAKRWCKQELYHSQVFQLFEQFSSILGCSACIMDGHLMHNMKITIKGLTNLHGFMTDQWLYGPSDGFMTDVVLWPNLINMVLWSILSPGCSACVCLFRARVPAYSSPGCGACVCVSRQQCLRVQF